METSAVGGKLNTLLLIMLYAVILAGAFISLYPFFLMIVVPLSTQELAFTPSPEWSIGISFINNISIALTKIDFFNALGNSLLVACMTTVAVLFICSLGGFAFAKYNFPGKAYLFGAIIISLLVPSQLSVLPVYVIVSKLGWLDTNKALIIPALASAFGMFWMRQYMSDAIHDEVIEAGRIDGCSHFRLYWNIAVPIILPAFAALAIFTFLSSWNDFFWPLVALKNEANYTVQLVLSQINAIREGVDYSMLFAAIFLATVPLILVFLLFSKWFINDVTIGSVKG